MTTRLLPWHPAEVSDVDALLFELQDQTNCREADMLTILEAASTVLRIILNRDEERRDIVARIAPGYVATGWKDESIPKSSPSHFANRPVFGVRCFVPLRAGGPAINPAHVKYRRDSAGAIELIRVILPMPGPSYVIDADTMDEDLYLETVEAVEEALQYPNSQVAAETFFPYPQFDREGD